MTQGRLRIGIELRLGAGTLQIENREGMAATGRAQACGGAVGLRADADLRQTSHADKTMARIKVPM